MHCDIDSGAAGPIASGDSGVGGDGVYLCRLWLLQKHPIRLVCLKVHLLYLNYDNNGYTLIVAGKHRERYCMQCLNNGFIYSLARCEVANYLSVYYLQNFTRISAYNVSWLWI